MRAPEVHIGIERGKGHLQALHRGADDGLQDGVEVGSRRRGKADSPVDEHELADPLGIAQRGDRLV